ncbi:7-carboxy-7-deazaguanine synthase QueE [Candidatus Contubernalis alkaliaceticus]|uniref:7-carboxy-7-deazaguanine synthase QueE n=1 Tax=Candidatus Contubernalis alkaliaceticus TaxID=338645 RepID=UPI001F4BF3D5|nr:7-carboxy-7-deazaguanine synthase QueE [Candidatus Contubernalis alkalaceticus]UNC92368.1 7-carboxy-7-deazaguanine synthase QueE [Candidatus Contubernalis alkalaceticus]
MKARLIEIFSSIQGEGIYIGHRQLFLRFFGCNLQCSFCDTVQNKLPLKCRVELKETAGEYLLRDNPLNTQELLKIVTLFPVKLHHSVSLTGGEPLLHHKFLKKFLPAFREETGLEIFLETNGTLIEELKELLPWIDYIAMDFKLPHLLGGDNYLKQHLEFLTLSLQKKVFVKIVVTGDSSKEELMEYIRAVRDVSSSVPVVLQPVTAKTDSLGISNSYLMELHSSSLKILSGVRVIPQTHIIMGYL